MLGIQRFLCRAGRPDPQQHPFKTLGNPLGVIDEALPAANQNNPDRCHAFIDCAPRVLDRSDPKPQSRVAPGVIQID